MSSDPAPRSAPLQPKLLAALVAGGFLASLWALFQWGELLVARAGGTPFCSISETFNCSAVWDSALARWVHTHTMVPIAGWGLMWGILAFALPLIALVDVRRLGTGLGTGLRIAAVAGVASCLALGTASFMAGAVCIGCLGTYLLVILWAVAAFMATSSSKWSEPQKGLLWAGGLTLAAYLALLGPGMKTPHALAEAGKDAIEKAAATAKPDDMSPKPEAPAGAPGPWDGPSTGDPTKDAALSELMGQLDANAKQIMSNLLDDYDKSKPGELPPARAIIGEKNAPIVFVDWTDPLCPHCAELHAVIDEIKKATPPGTIAVEPHFFPLDQACNAAVQRKGDTGEIRCAATKAMLCLEDEPDKLALAQKIIFENQAGLTSVDKVYEALKPIADRKKLETCAEQPDTQAKLATDIDFANKNHLEGTPLVLMNGKEVKPFGPILYSLTLTGGKTHAAPFKVLPPPKAMPPPQ